MTFTIEERKEDQLPDYAVAQEFYAQYEPKEILGKGISSIVRRCVSKVDGQSYAVKIIDLTEIHNADANLNDVRESTQREIDMLRLCAEHPNVIELHDTFNTPTFMFLVFELCRRGELFDYLTEVVTLSEKRVRVIMRQLLEAVKYVHGRGVVHRDLKPENILLDDLLNVKVTDFGFALRLEQGEEVRDLCGTPGYLAPEVLKVSMYDDASGYGAPVDMWACGVIMYTLLCGCPPFWHRKQLYMLRAIMEGTYRFYSPEWDDISQAPKDLISRLLVVEPDKRLTAVQALAHPFFQLEELQLPLCGPGFDARRKLRAAGHAIIALRRLMRLRAQPPSLELERLRKDPYSNRLVRRLVDNGAFRIYGHWVKRGENQNRAALFETQPRRERQDSFTPKELYGFEVRSKVGRNPPRSRTTSECIQQH